MIFADTGGIYAMVHRKDPQHEEAARWVASTSETFILTELVEAEVLTLVRRRTDHHTAVALGDALRSSAVFQVEPSTPEDRERAWQIFRDHVDKRWSFVDCHSFAVMERLGIETAFTTDNDFRQRGFAIVP